MTELTDPTARRRSRWHLLLRLAVVVAVLVVLQQAGMTVMAHLEHWLALLGPRWGAAVLVLVTGSYVLVMALPFVPAMEIALVLMMVLGVPGIVTVYGATLLSLALGFLVGRLIPVGLIERVLGGLHMRRAQALVRRLHPMTAEARVAYLIRTAPPRIVPFLLRHRYVALALLFNLPGNSLVGGGGGIALLAGLSRLFSFPRYVLMVALAISPVPLLLLGHQLWPRLWP